MILDQSAPVANCSAAKSEQVKCFSLWSPQAVLNGCQDVVIDILKERYSFMIHAAVDAGLGPSRHPAFDPRGRDATGDIAADGWPDRPGGPPAAMRGWG